MLQVHEFCNTDLCYTAFCTEGAESWWVLRGIHRRSHPELDPESPPRRWYCGLSHGRVGPRQLSAPLFSVAEFMNLKH